jgi:hypothetical protein
MVRVELCYMIQMVCYRCLNRDRSGKILLNLCISLLLMNLAYLLVAIEEYMDSSLMIVVDVCNCVAVLTHYLVLTSLMWMLVEAINMYQLLITVFATSETKFMCKRMLCAWGMCQNYNYLIIFLWFSLFILCLRYMQVNHYG